MNGLVRRAVVWVAALMVGAPAALAQQGGARIGYVYPAGGRVDAKFKVTVGGKGLDGVYAAYVSGKGVRAGVVEHIKPMSPNQVQNLREKLKELTDKRRATMPAGPKPSIDGEAVPTPAPAPAAAGKDGWTAADERMIAQIRRQLATANTKPGTPAIAEMVTLQVTIDRNAEPGEREVRLLTQAGFSNPLAFMVGSLPEFVEPEAPGGGPREPGGATREALPVTVPAVVNGRIMPGEADRYRFRAGKGTSLTVMVAARQLIPYLPDAVPGWFQATVGLRDAAGKEVAYADDFRFQPDPVLYFKIPAEGEYVLEIKDSIYRGREDFVYRVTLGEQPFITGIFPLGGPVGVPTAVQIKGWNLPRSRLTMTPASAGIHPLYLRRTEWVASDELLSGTKIKADEDELISAREVGSNRVPFMADDLPECVEREPNDEPEAAQKLDLPVIVNGRMDKAGDSDAFRFEGRKGQQVVAEVFARRLDSPVDSVLTLTDAAGTQLAFNDDHVDKGAGLTTHHADSFLMATLPADGTYYLYLADNQNKGGPEYGYRLRLGAPRPDFELRAVPSGLNVRPGATIVFSAHALRKDGFTGDIALGLKGAPAGFVLGGSVVPAGQDQVRLTLTAPGGAAVDPMRIRLEGRAVVGGREVVRQAVAADDLMQAFAYHHLVPARELMLTTGGGGGGGGRTAGEVLATGPVKIPAGGTARVRVRVIGGGPADKIGLELNDPPEGITAKETVRGADGVEMVLEADGAKAKPGLRGNLIVGAYAEAAAAGGRGARKTALGLLPAVPFEVVGR